MINDSELARRQDGRIELRPGGLRMRWNFPELTTADGHATQASFACTIRALPDANDLKMLEEALLSTRPFVTIADVAAHFAPSLQSAAKRLAAEKSAESILTADGRAQLLACLLEAANNVAFASGVEVVAPTQLDVDCPSLDRARLETLQRQTAQRRAADNVDYLRHSAELFAQFETIRKSAPELLPGEILSRIGVSDQADVLRSLLLASAEQTKRRTLWAVAGTNLIRLDPAADSPVPQVIALGADLGPFRSVQGASDGTLLLGCRGGVMRVRPETPGEATLYRDSETTSSFGFNAAVVTADFLWATHGESGLVRWKLDQADRPDLAIRPRQSPIPAFSPRNLQIFSPDLLLLSSGPQLLATRADGTIEPAGAPADSDIAAIVVQPQRILTLHDDGCVAVRSSEDFSAERQQRRSGRITAAAVLPWLGDVRLLLACEDGAVLCAGVDDELLTQYAGPHRGLRMLAGAPSAVAAVTPDRQRLILWHAWDGRAPRADLYLFGVSHHRIAGIAFV